MRIVAIINDKLVVEKILKHLGLWQPQAHSPPVSVSSSETNKKIIKCFPTISDVEGKIVDVSGEPREGVLVKLGDRHVGMSIQGGGYSIDDVEFGDYELQAIVEKKRSQHKKIKVDKHQKNVGNIIFPIPLEEIDFCKEIEKIEKGEYIRADWNLKGVSNEFINSVGTVNCFTRIKGANRNTIIKHRWYWRNELIAEVPLEVNSPDWRTYSRKKIPSDKTGTWRVDVVDKDNNVLKSAEFNIKKFQG